MNYTTKSRIYFGEKWIDGDDFLNWVFEINVEREIKLAYNRLEDE